MKYEYLLHVWGGFWNAGNIAIHGDLDVPYRWFDSKSDRQAEIDRLDELCNSLGTFDACIAKRLTEGFLTRKEFVIQSFVKDNGNLVIVENNLGYGFWSDDEFETEDSHIQYMKDWKWDVGYDGDGQRIFTTLILR